MNQKIPKKEKMPYLKLCLKVSERTKAIRNISYLVNSSFFKEVWEKCTVFQQEEALKHFEAHDKHALNLWMMMHESMDFGEKSWKALMEHAKWYKIKNYSRMDKLELIRALKQLKENPCELKDRDALDERETEQTGHNLS